MVEKVGLNEWLAYVLKQAQVERVKGDTRAGLQLARQYNIDCVEGDSRSFRCTEFVSQSD